MDRNHQLSTSRGGAMTKGSDTFLSLHREMNRLFDDVFRGFGLPVARESGDGGTMLQPVIDVSETDKEFKICADMPGVSEKDVEVMLNGDVLTIKAERRQERTDTQENYHLVERSHGTFQRALRLPPNIDAEHVDAQFENGVLVVKVPKTAETRRSRRVTIQGKQSNGEVDRNGSAEAQNASFEDKKQNSADDRGKQSSHHSVENESAPGTREQ